jgi:hypothetical protein
MNKPYPAFLTGEMRSWLNAQHAIIEDLPLLTTAELTVAFVKRFELTPEQAGKLLAQYVKRT